MQTLEDTQRKLTSCIACGDEKDLGLVVCWNCYKYIDNPYKTSNLDFEEWLKTVKSNNAILLTQEQAEAILQLQLANEGFLSDYFVMAKGYNDDWENYTELTTEDLENVAEGCYTNYELWTKG